MKSRWDGEIQEHMAAGIGSFAILRFWPCPRATRYDRGASLLLDGNLPNELPVTPEE